MSGKLWLAIYLLTAFESGPSLAEPPSFYFEMVQAPGADFWVARCEVTQAQYLEVTGENPSRFQGDSRPVDRVNWEDAVAFCETLTLREHRAGRLPAEYAYDLPTDAQWDLFAVGTNLADAVTSLTTPREGTDPVGQHAANPLGLYDVVGNVWEWCRDWYDNRIRKKDANRDLPNVPSDVEAAANGPAELYKVLRGGAWDTSTAGGFSLASRLRYAPGMSNYHTGFRCVVVKVDPPSNSAAKPDTPPADPPPPRR